MLSSAAPRRRTKTKAGPEPAPRPTESEAERRLEDAQRRLKDTIPPQPEGP
jgi:hypothetical protein